MRPRTLGGVVLLASALVGLASIQFFASVALRAHAEPYAWMRSLAAAPAAAIDRFAERLPLPATLRLVLAREALAHGDIARSDLLATGLAPSSDRLALTGDLAQARGDLRSAARAYLAAGDVDALEEHVAVLEQRGDLPAALGLQTAAIERLRKDPTQGQALALAYFELGVLRQAQAYRYDVGRPERKANALRSQWAYARAVALAPLDERYLLALGNQALNLGDLAAAERSFVRAREADPASAAAFTGLGETALRRGDRASAHRFLVEARSRDAASDAVRRFAGELAR